MDWAMKHRRKQVRCEFNLYPLYEENDVKFSDEYNLQLFWKFLQENDSENKRRGTV